MVVARNSSGLPRKGSMRLGASAVVLVTLIALSACSSTDRLRVDGQKEMPNIVFIMADDLGWRDTGIYGSTFYETPHIDALAKRGMLFTNAYTANPTCSPTRASIMTGLWPSRIGFTAPNGADRRIRLKAEMKRRNRPSYRATTARSVTRLDLNYVTLAETLQAAGYRTGHFGKWHLGQQPYDPLHQGFDVDVPRYWGAGPARDYVAPWNFPSALDFYGNPGDHLEDRMAEEAVKFIIENKAQPFFLNYWSWSVHSRYDAKKALIEKYRSKIDPANPQRNPVMAAMIESLDDAVGTLMKSLEDEGLADNTIVVFFSDNGGNMYDRVDNVAPTNNWPLRGGKGTIYDGGTRSPLVFIWPEAVKGGTKSQDIVQSIDFYPTFLDMLNLETPEGLEFDGVSFLPALKGRHLDREAIFCHWPHNPPHTGAKSSTYVRKGDWKLIRFYYDGDKQPDDTYAHRYELYNLKYDPGELNNLANAQPGEVQKLDALIETFLINSETLAPRPNPYYDAATEALLPDIEALNTGSAYGIPVPKDPVYAPKPALKKPR